MTKELPTHHDLNQDQKHDEDQNENNTPNTSINQDQDQDQDLEYESSSEYDSDSDFDEYFSNLDITNDISIGGSGTLTQNYNRQRLLVHDKKVPRFNPKGGSAAAVTIATHELEKAKLEAAAMRASKPSNLTSSEESNTKSNLSTTTQNTINNTAANTRDYKDHSALLLAKLESRIKLNESLVGSAAGSGGALDKTSGHAKGSAKDDRANRATQEQVLDPRTRMILFKMINRGIVFEINGCISTGKEANVYHALTESGEHRAIKIYKTSILVFKDRERYVKGEFRFQRGYNKSNPRKMVKLWAEKEFRNLCRISQCSDIPVPEAVYLRHHVLVMKFLGSKKGWASPRLRDADHLIEDPDTEFQHLYYQLLAYMRLLYQQCRLVHADLSEYNILYHEKRLWLIDVSQSVEHDHPHSLEFLRMDIKNVSDFFRRKGHTANMFSERRIYNFITEPDIISFFFSSSSSNTTENDSKTAATNSEDISNNNNNNANNDNDKTKPTTPLPSHIQPITDIKKETTPYLISILESLPIQVLTDKDRFDDNVFRESFIPKTLKEVMDAVGEDAILNGSAAGIMSYTDKHLAISKFNLPYEDEEQEQEKEQKEQKGKEIQISNKNDLKSEENNTEDKDQNDDDDDDDNNDDDEDEDDEDQDDDDEDQQQTRKFTDRDANKERKKAIKEEARLRRQKKMKKTVKKKLINKAAGAAANSSTNSSGGGSGHGHGNSGKSKKKNLF